MPRTQGRWSYKTTPKPRVMIRKQVDEEELLRRNFEAISTEAITTEPLLIQVDEAKTVANTTTTIGTTLPAGIVNVQRKEIFLTEEELDPSESEDFTSVSVQEQQHVAEQIIPVETLNVEISTAANLDNIYFEIATIKSPYSFQVNILILTR